MTAVPLLDSTLSCPPRWGTPRRLDRPTLGPRVAQTAQMFGQPFMPWQQYVADVAGEINPETGKLVYREVVLLVPRQSGKTTLLLAEMVHRARAFPGRHLALGRSGTPGRQRILYTAQTRNDAREKWHDDHVQTLAQSPLSTLYTVTTNNGSEAIHWDNGSTHGITSTTEKAGHDKTLDFAGIDEAFAHKDSRLEQALSPTMITRPEPQIWVTSTAGTRDSVYLRAKVDSGRKRVESQLTQSSCYFEWGALPDADPGDPRTWWGCMPALGHTIDEEAIAAEYDKMKLSDFRRAYLNQWLDEAAHDWLVIPRALWFAGMDPDSEIQRGTVSLSVEMSLDRAWTSIAVAGRNGRGYPQVELTADGRSVDHRPGTTWALPRLIELVKRLRPVALVIDPGGPAASLITELDQAGIDVVKPTVRDQAQACSQMYDHITESRDLVHLGQDQLSRSVASLSRRRLGNTSLWDMTQGQPAAMVAATNALWGYAKFRHLSGDYDVLDSVY